MWPSSLGPSALPQVLATSNGMRNLYGLERVGLVQAGAWYYPQDDAIGSVRQWTDAAGAVVGMQAYGPSSTLTGRRAPDQALSVAGPRICFHTRVSLPGAWAAAGRTLVGELQPVESRHSR